MKKMIFVKGKLTCLIHIGIERPCYIVRGGMQGDRHGSIAV
jgi:hypothetical protein